MNFTCTCTHSRPVSLWHQWKKTETLLPKNKKILLFISAFTGGLHPHTHTPLHVITTPTFLIQESRSFTLENCCPRPCFVNNSARLCSLAFRLKQETRFPRQNMHMYVAQTTPSPLGVRYTVNSTSPPRLSVPGNEAAHCLVQFASPQ